MTDPFVHVPELRDRLTPLDQTRFREGFTEMVRGIVAQLGLPEDDITPDDVREAHRTAFFDGYEGELWVFGYGSLIWDPAIAFDQVRRARVEGYARSMCLYDDGGGRGSPGNPGLMAALAPGPHCDGMAFRIPAELVETETGYLWAREMIADGYLPTFQEVWTPQGQISALMFVADFANENMRPDLPREDQVRFIAHGAGELGSSFEYVDGLITHFDLLGIDDPHLRGLWQDAVALRGSAVG